MIPNAARSGRGPSDGAAHKKRRPSATRRWALQQLIHRGSGSTDSTILRRPPRCGRRTLPPGLRVFRDAARIVAPPAFLHNPVQVRRVDAMRDARTPTPRDDSRCALRHDDPGSRPGHPHAFAVHPRRPTGTVGLVRHACTSSFRTNPIARMERKAAHSRRRYQRRSEYPGRSAIHVCNTTRCDSVSFHSLVPVFDTSDPLKR